MKSFNNFPWVNLWKNIKDDKAKAKLKWTLVSATTQEVDCEPAAITPNSSAEKYGNKRSLLNLPAKTKTK